MNRIHLPIVVVFVSRFIPISVSGSLRTIYQERLSSNPKARTRIDRGELGHTYSQYPQPVQAFGLTTTRPTISFASHAKSSASCGQAVVQAPHSRPLPSRHVARSTWATPIGAEAFRSAVNFGIAPTGQACPQAVQDAGQ